MAPGDYFGLVRKDERGRWGKLTGLLGEHPPSGSYVSAPTPSILQGEVAAQEGIAGEDSRGSLLDDNDHLLAPDSFPRTRTRTLNFSLSPDNALAPLQRLADQIKANHIDGLSFGSYSDSPTPPPPQLPPCPHTFPFKIPPVVSTRHHHALWLQIAKAKIRSHEIHFSAETES